MALIFNVKVKLNVPVLPEGIAIESGETGKFISFIDTKSGIVEVKLYLSGLLIVAA